MSNSRDDKFIITLFVFFLKIVFKWGWPLWLFAIANTIARGRIQTAIPNYLTPLLSPFISPPMLNKVVNYANEGAFILWWFVCYSIIADIINKRIGEVVPSFRMIYHNIRDGVVGRVLLGSLGFIVAFMVGGSLGFHFGGAYGAFCFAFIAVVLVQIFRWLHGKGETSANTVIDFKKDSALIKEITEKKPAHVLSGFVGSTPIYTTDKQRTQHTQVIGSSGSGKTESVIKNWAYQDIARGRGFAMLDPKGDIKLASEIFFLNNGGKKINYLSLLHDCENSQTYNPLAYGDPSQCANKIFNSFDWENDYYKMRAFDFYQSLLRIMFRHSKHRYKERVLLGDTLQYLRDPRQCEELGKSVNDTEDRAELTQLARTKAEDLSGLYSKLSMLCRSETVSKVFRGSDINIKEVVDNGEILLCQLPTAAYGIESKAIARMIIQDLNLVSSYRQQDLGAKEFYPVFIDEFNSFIFEGFLDFLEKARSANMGLVLAHQSLANLERINPAYKKQVFENCSTKIIMSHNDPDSAKYIAQAIGEYYHKATTHTDSQTSEVLGLNGHQGKAVSVREEKRFIVEPTWILNLNVGESFYLGNGGAVERVRMRHFGAYYRDEMHDMNLLKKGRLNNVSNNQATRSPSSRDNEDPRHGKEQTGSSQETQSREAAENGEDPKGTIKSETKEYTSRPQF